MRSMHRQSLWMRSFFLLLPYLFALAVTGLATAALFALPESITPSILALLFLLPVGVSTILWGLGAGIVVAFLAFLSFNYFIEPYYSLLVHQTQDLLVLIAFLTVAVVISQMVGRTRQSLKEAKAREREAIRLYELSVVLGGLNSEQAIAQTLAHHAFETFRAERVEISMEGQPGQTPIRAALPQEGAPLPTPADLVIPLQTAQRVLGEIRLWRGAPALSPADERLLRTFASQAVLALERTLLLAAATRARILEESDRLKSSLLSSVSHELRTPLATIKAAATSLRDETVAWDTEARSELLTAIEEETDRLDQLVGNLLNLSRIEAGALKPERKWNVLLTFS